MDRMTVHELQTASAVIDALGGTAATARLTGRKAQHVTNWRAANRLPANTYIVLNEALTERGLNASPKVWGMVERPERAAS